MKKNNRAKRISKEIIKIVNIILQREIKDPRICSITASHISLSKDFSYAKIFISFLNKKEPKDIKNSIAILQNASGFIRNILSKKIHIYRIPILVFFHDYYLEKNLKILELIKKLNL